ncbi:MAG: hypothetical protein KDC05_13535 [Bacteroidales bacterium]|nr:hypothetical protein [Bacteroidales bacterium]
MINGKQNRENDQFKELVKKSGMEQAPGSFTENVMKAVQQHSVPEELSTSRSWYSSGYFLTGVIASSILVALVAFFYFYGNILLVKEFDPVFSPVLKDLYQSLAVILHSIKLSSTTLVIIGGFVLLLILDLILRRSTFSGKTYLTF